MNNEPAFPTLGDEFMKTPDGGWARKTDYGMEGKSGLTKLEYFAGLAMQGLAQSWSIPTGPCRAMNDAAYTAVSMAKALLAALEMEQSNGK